MKSESKENFSLEAWVKDKTRKVVDEDGRPVEIFPLGLPEAFWPLVPKDVDPATCHTYHFRREGERNAHVLVGGPYKTLFFDD